ncbi:unnamed protein product, partial [Protopolystoma xenopodis]
MNMTPPACNIRRHLLSAVRRRLHLLQVCFCGSSFEKTSSRLEQVTPTTSSPSLADYPPPHDMVLPGLFTPATEIVEESDELSTQTGGFLSPGGPVGLSDWPDADLFRLLLVPGTPVGPKSPGDLSEPTSGLGISIQSLRDQVPADWLDTGLSPSATGMSDANMMLQMGIYPTRFTEGGAYTLPALTSALGNTDWPAAGVATSGSRTLPTCTTDRVPIPPAHLPQPGVF